MKSNMFLASRQQGRIIEVISDYRRITATLAEALGFEPGQTEPKSVVLPLHHASIWGAP